MNPAPPPFLAQRVGDCVHPAIELTAGLERTFLNEIKRTLKRDGVETWGEFEDV